MFLTQPRPLSGSPAPHLNSLLHSGTARYWFDPKSNGVLIAELPPTSTAVLVLANIVPGETALSLAEIRDQYIAQERDAFNSEYRSDGGAYNTNVKRKERGEYYEKQKPGNVLGKLHYRVETGSPSSPPICQLERGGGALRQPYWIPVFTPDRFTYSTVIATNYATQGLMHSLIRHGHEFYQNGLNRDILQVLPSGMTNIVKSLRNMNSNDMNTAFTSRMLQMEENEFKLLHQLQLEAHNLIQKYVSTGSYLGECVNTNGQLQVFWKVTSSTAMVLALSEQLYQGQERCDSRGKKRPIKKIITVFFKEMKDFDGKKAGNWPVTRNQILRPFSEQVIRTSDAMVPRIVLLAVTVILPLALCQNLLEIYKAMIADQSARAKSPPIDIEFFGESLCPDTTRYFRNHIMPVWTALQASTLVNITYHPFGLADCKRGETGIRCQCQHGPAECQLNMLQTCVISALQIPQLYLPIVSCMQQQRKFSSAIDECIVNFRPRPDLDENFMARCAQSQLGAKLMMQHGFRQREVASELDWVPWILINGRRSQAAENQLKTIVCSFPEPSRYEFCKTPEELIF
ncbi:unnamed protein product [Caenorhabditis sp. 36 PRJEB53466]|nr:unnamed protein product [Caenorhabditis sp. 36 PRJEB53466]